VWVDRAGRVRSVVWLDQRTHIEECACAPLVFLCASTLGLLACCCSHVGRKARGFRAQGELLLRQLRANLRKAVVEYNSLGLAGPPAQGFQSPADRLRTFANWLETAAHALAGPRAYQRASKSAWTTPIWPWSSSRHSRGLHQAAALEVKGIVAALIQPAGWVVVRVYWAATLWTMLW
jgi:hypothetical protein